MASTAEYFREYNKKRKAYLQEYHRAYHIANRDKKVAISRAHYAANRETSLEKQRARREMQPMTDEQKARKLETARARRTADPAKYAIKKRESHARRRAATMDKLSNARIAELLASPCASCGSTAHPEIDHIMPLALGGTNTDDNVQTLCRPCNRSKGAKHPNDWKGRRIR